MYNLDFNITNYCNARCPTCKRFDTKEKKWEFDENLNLVHMDFEKFKSIYYFNQDTFKNFTCQFAGEFGDPMMHPDVEKFIDFTCSNYKFLKINTNAGTRNPEFYKRISRHKNLEIYFSIDGLTHEVNNRYRINVNTKRAFENMWTFHRYNKYAHWDFVIFKHNAHEVIDAIKLAQKMNIHITIKSNLRDDHIPSQVFKPTEEQLIEIRNFLSNNKLYTQRISFTDV